MKTLDNTIFSSVYDITWSNGDEDLFDKISMVMTVFVLASIVLNIIRPVPYGKSAVISKRPKTVIWPYNLSSKFVWRVSISFLILKSVMKVCSLFMIQYGFIATIVVPVIMAFLTPCSKIGNFCNAAGLAIHLIHYFNR